MDYYKTLNLFLYLCVLELVSLRTDQSPSVRVNSFIKHIFHIIYLFMYLFICTHLTMGKSKPLRNIPLSVAGLRGKLALQSYFRERGDWGGGVEWGGRWRGREKGRGILLHSHFLK